MALNLGVRETHAAATATGLTTANMSAPQFDSLFAPVTTVLSQNYAFLNMGTAGTLDSQVFIGKGAAGGAYAYAYQFTLNNATDTSTGAPNGVNSVSIGFSLPIVFQFAGANAGAYVITDGEIGGLSGSPLGGQVPASIAFVPGTQWPDNDVPGALTFQFLNPTTGTGPLESGATSATLVILATLSYIQEFASLQNAEPQTADPLVYAPDNSFPIYVVPAPEPATIFGWSCALAAVALARGSRRRHDCP